jgi:hypothetical protein
MLVLFSIIGAGALWLTFTWLAAAIVASQFSAQKGYGEKPGLVTGPSGPPATCLAGTFTRASPERRRAHSWPS